MKKRALDAIWLLVETILLDEYKGYGIVYTSIKHHISIPVDYDIGWDAPRPHTTRTINMERYFMNPLVILMGVDHSDKKIYLYRERIDAKKS